MGKYDVAVCQYLSDNERFAELFNASEFGGKPMLTADMLESEDGRYNVLLPKTQSGKMKTKTCGRDIKKRTRNGDWLVITAIENQENIDFTMPLRIMEYDCMEYNTQVRKIRANKDREQREQGLTPTGWTTQLTAEDKLHPVHTMCFYHGTEPWNGPRSLKDMMDFQGAPPEWKDHFHDYQMSLFCADEVEDLSCFKTGLKQFLEVSALRKNRKELVELWNREEYRHLDRDTAEVIAVITDANDVLEQLDRYEKEGEYDMCQAMDEWKEELLESGTKIGIETGIMRSIRSIMHTMALSIDQAMDALQIPEDERALYRSKIQ